jgi:hypothetical protein
MVDGSSSQSAVAYPDLARHFGCALQFEMVLGTVHRIPLGIFAYYAMAYTARGMPKHV